MKWRPQSSTSSIWHRLIGNTIAVSEHIYNITLKLQKNRDSKICATYIQCNHFVRVLHRKMSAILVLYHMFIDLLFFYIDFSVWGRGKGAGGGVGEGEFKMAKCFVQSQKLLSGVFFFKDRSWIHKALLKCFIQFEKSMHV